LQHVWTNPFDRDKENKQSISFRTYPHVHLTLSLVRDIEFIVISSCFINDIVETAMGEHVGAQLSQGNNEFVEATGR
jgi:hypothetical protein